jgi:hypothetical protein
MEIMNRSSTEEGYLGKHADDAMGEGNLEALTIRLCNRMCVS